MASSVEILVTEEGEEHIIRRGAVVRISSAKGILIVENIKYQAKIYHTMIWRNNVPSFLNSISLPKDLRNNNLAFRTKL